MSFLCLCVCSGNVTCLAIEQKYQFPFFSGIERYSSDSGSVLFNKDRKFTDIIQKIFVGFHIQISLENIYITDDSSNLVKHRIKKLEIKANNYILLYFSKDSKTYKEDYYVFWHQTEIELNTMYSYISSIFQNK